VAGQPQIPATRGRGGASADATRSRGTGGALPRVIHIVIHIVIPTKKNTNK